MSAPGSTVAVPRQPGRNLRLEGSVVGGALGAAYLSLVVLIPLVAVVAESTIGGPLFVTHDQEEALEAEQVAVIQSGRIEQTGTPDELYEQPANEFVMGFVGPISRFGETWVRPHDIDVLEDLQDGAIEALVERVARVGFEVRVAAVLGDGTRVSVRVTRDQAELLELVPGRLVWLRTTRPREFAGAGLRQG